MLVHSAGIQDRTGARELINTAMLNGATLKKGWVDGAYAGPLIEWAKQTWDIDLEVVKRNELHTFVVLPKRWIVERTNAWMIRSRRLARDYERSAETEEAWIKLAMIRLMLRRISQEYA